MLMNGIEPPSPSNIGGAWKYALDARVTESRSQSAITGAFQPLPGRSPVENVTRAPYGGSASSTCFTRVATRSGSAVGGRRRGIFADVFGRNHVPAGTPPATPATPVIAGPGPPRW